MPVAGMVASPLVAAALGAAPAAGFMVPLLIVGDLIALASYRQHADWRLIRRLIPGVLGGFVLTAAFFWLLSGAVLNRALGLLLLITAGLEVWRIRGRVTGTATMSRGGAAFFGTLTGLSTMAANAGGAAMTLYLVKMRVPILTFLGTSTWFFAILNVLKVPPLILLGLLTPSSVQVSAWFVPAMVAGALFGRWAIPRINERTFTWVGLGLTVLGATWLIVQA
jgi:uncharacterized membrane protein YfcA